MHNVAQLQLYFSVITANTSRTTAQITVIQELNVSSQPQSLPWVTLDALHCWNDRRNDLLYYYAFSHPKTRLIKLEAGHSIECITHADTHFVIL